MEIKTLQLNEFIVSGITVHTSNELESNPQTANIPSLWQRFFSEVTEDKLGIITQPDYLYGVYYDYDNISKGEYNVLAGMAVENAVDGEKNQVTLQIPANRYLVFTGQGKVPDVMYETWQAVWDYFSQSTNEQREFKIDFERFNKNNSSQLEIFISIK